MLLGGTPALMSGVRAHRLILSEQAREEHVLRALTFKRDPSECGAARVPAGYQYLSIGRQEQFCVLFKAASASSGGPFRPIGRCSGVLGNYQSFSGAGCIFGVDGNVNVTAAAGNPVASLVIAAAFADRGQQNARGVIRKDDEVAIVRAGMLARAEASDCARGLRSNDRLALLDCSVTNVSHEARHADIAVAADRQGEPHRLIAANVTGPFNVAVGVVLHDEGIIGIVRGCLHRLAEASHAQTVSVGARESGRSLEPTADVDIIGSVSGDY